MQSGGKAIACFTGTGWANDMTTSRTKCTCETATSPVTCSCGNGVIDSGEQCDGSMLGLTGSCMAMGMGMGVLGCDPMTCRYDTSMCTGSPGSTPTGGTGGGGTSG